MERGIIITLPRYDDVSEYLSQFSAFIEHTAKSYGIKIKPLRDKEANRNEFEKVIKNLNYQFIILNGHGSDDEIYGNKEFILKLGVNEYLIK